MKAPHFSVADIIPFSWVDGPGNRFVLFLQGCNFNCLACHNPQTIPVMTPRSTDMSVTEVIDRIRLSTPFISGVTISGGEATLQHEAILSLFSQIKNDPSLNHLTTFIDSNGNADHDIWDSIASVTDGVMLDLKVLDDALHHELTGGSNKSVLDSISYLNKIGKLFEVRLLLVPGINDSDELLIRTSNYLVSIYPALRIKLNAFKRHGVRASARQWPEANESHIEKYRKLLSSHGVHNVA